jgi:hypothetical protein
MTLPSIPDNTYKFLLYIGIVLVGYSFLQSMASIENYNAEVKSSNSYIDSLTIRELFQKRQKENLMEMADDLSLKYNVKNPITDQDSITIFSETITGPKNDVFVTDTLRKIWARFKDGNFQISLINEKIKMTKEDLKIADDENTQENYFYLALAIFGMLCLFGGFAGMEKNQSLQEKLIEIEISHKEPKYKFCQSCGANFSAIRINGTNFDSEINLAFCKDCFENGQFKEPNLSLEEFKKRTQAIIERCNSKSKRKAMQKRFENLERWKVDDYT